MFLGSGTAIFKDQIAADLYRRYVWTAIGIMQRVATVCVTYGVSVAVVLIANITERGTVPAKDKWEIHSPSLFIIEVQDEGAEFMHVPGAPNPADLPNRDVLPGPDEPEAFYLIAGEILPAKPIPWHHRVTLRRREPGATLHYHEHAPRKGHTDPSPILDRGIGKHREFGKAVYGTQLQMSRSTEGVISTFNPRKHVSESIA